MFENINLSHDIAFATKIIPHELWNTIYMVAVSGCMALLLGFPLGILLTLTSRGGLKEFPFFYGFLSTIVNIGRSIPFAILIVAIFPLTRAIVGTSIGTTAAIVPLTLAAAPFFARIVESAFKEIESPIIEAALVMGSTPQQIVWKVFVPEALPALIRGMALMMVNLIGYSAMAGLVGGGGLGKVAIQYGYQRFNGFLMLITLILLLGLVECVQWIGNTLAETLVHKRGKG